MTTRCLIILVNDPDEPPFPCSLDEAAELLKVEPCQIEEGFAAVGRFDTIRHVVIPLEQPEPFKLKVVS